MLARQIIKTFYKPLVRNVHNVIVNNITEEVYTQNDYSLKRSNFFFHFDKISVIGYGPQGRGQALNLRDNGLNVQLGLREGNSWNKALEDGWIPEKNLFSIEEAADKGTIIQYLLSDAGQMKCWNKIKPYLTEGKTLYFSHGFGIVYKDQTKIIPPSNIDVIMVAPKGTGSTVRKAFLENSGINGSWAVYQNYSGNAKHRCLSLGTSIGLKNLFKTTFEKEVYSDLTGERCVLLGLIDGAFRAQYNVLRKNNHSPLESFNETVEEALISLYPLINEKGMDWLLENCSTTAQRGALDWSERFKSVLEPVIEECYENVKNGKEAQRVLDKNSDDNSYDDLQKELKEMREEEIWKVGECVRKFR